MVSIGSFSSITASSTDSSVEKPVKQHTHSIPRGVKLVGDNIDKGIKPREMREDAQAQSLHYFNGFAVENRIQIEGLEDNPCLPDFDSFDMKKILPTSADLKAIRSNFGILIGRVLKKHFKFFSEFATGVVKHIKHDHYEEMSQKSEVVSEKAVHYNINISVMSLINSASLVLTITTCISAPLPLKCVW